MHVDVVHAHRRRRHHQHHHSLHHYHHHRCRHRRRRTVTTTVTTTCTTHRGVATEVAHSPPQQPQSHWLPPHNIPARACSPRTAPHHMRICPSPSIVLDCYIIGSGMAVIGWLAGSEPPTPPRLPCQRAARTHHTRTRRGFLFKAGSRPAGRPVRHGGSQHHPAAGQKLTGGSSVSQSVGQSVSQSVRRSVSQSVSQAVSQSVGQSVSQSVSSSASQPVRQKP